MSKAGCPGPSATNKFHFKGVENFLKRVAYNLGNSPSQTDVKIISCIPIDVSDLQQKILTLEKQLEETKCFRMSNNQRPIINTAICECPPLSNTAVSCNMLDIDRSTSPDGRMSRPHHRRCSKKKSNVSFIVPPEKRPLCLCPTEENTSFYPPDEKMMPEEKYPPDIPCENYCSFMGGDSKVRGCRKYLFMKKNKCCKYKKSKAQCVYYAQTRSTPFNTTTNKYETMPKRTKVMSRSYLTEMINKQYRPRPLGGHLSEISNFSAPICRDSINFNKPNCYESDLCSCFHEGYQNIDKHINASGQNPYIINSNELVAESGYYDSTFYDVFPVKEKPIKGKKCVEVLKKSQIKPWVDVRKPSEEITTNLYTYPLNNSLYVNGQALPPSTANVLHRVPKINTRDPPPVRMIPKRRNKMSNIERDVNIQESKSCCIDLRNADYQPKIINKSPQDDTSLEDIHEPRKSDAECLTTIVVSNDCETATSIDANADIKTEKTLNQIKSILQSVLQEVKDTAASKCSTDGKAKKDVDIQKDVSQHTVLDNAQSDIPHNLKDTNKENIQSNVPNNIQGNEMSTVLGNRSNMANSFPGAEPTSMQLPAHMQPSSFMNSFTYSPYNTNPCIPSCSKQLNSNSYCYSSPPPLKYFMNYPVYFHNPERRHMCASCYRHNSYLKPKYNKQAITTATNTDHVIEEPKKETHKLIKEIYNSMAVNMGVNKKENSLSEVDNVQKLTNDAKHSDKSEKNEQSQAVKEFRKATSVIHAVSELFRKKDILVSSESRHSTTEYSRQESIGDIIIPPNDNKTKWRQNKQDCKTSEESHQNNSTTTQNSVTISLSESESTTASEATIVSPQSKNVQRSTRKKKKVSLFSKFKSVFKQKDKKNYDKKGNSVETIDTEELTSDSDDYQTIYSQKIEKPIKYTPKANNFPKRRTHSKISYNKQAYQTERGPANVIRRSPYMEQEYRRYWNEKLTFQDDRHRQSSDVPTYSHGYSSESKPPFYQRYEARAAVIQPKKVPIQHINAKNIVLPKQQKLLSDKTDPKTPTKRLAWLQNCKLECKKENWKKLITDN